MGCLTLARWTVAALIILCVLATFVVITAGLVGGGYEHDGESVGEHVLGVRIFSDAGYQMCLAGLVPLAMVTGSIAIAITVGQLRR